MARNEIKGSAKSIISNVGITLERDMKSSREAIVLYDEWSEKYESDEKLVGNNMHELLVDLLEETLDSGNNVTKSCSVLDIAAGTGLVAEYLRERGFTGRFDGHDGAPKMLEIAEKKGVYDRTFCHLIEPETAMPAELSASNYDVVLSSGALLLPHIIHYKALRQFVNTVRVGGLIGFNNRKATTQDHLEYSINLQREAFNLEQLGVWKLENVKYSKQYRSPIPELNEPGPIGCYAYIYKKLKDL